MRDLVCPVGTLDISPPVPTAGPCGTGLLVPERRVDHGDDILRQEKAYAQCPLLNESLSLLTSAAMV
jgi:hypothetical protein